MSRLRAQVQAPVQSEMRFRCCIPFASVELFTQRCNKAEGIARLLGNLYFRDTGFRVKRTASRLKSAENRLFALRPYDDITLI